MKERSEAVGAEEGAASDAGAGNSAGADTRDVGRRGRGGWGEVLEQPLTPALVVQCLQGTSKHAHTVHNASFRCMKKKTHRKTFLIHRLL